MDYWSPKHVELLNVMNKINHQILCILLDYRYTVQGRLSHITQVQSYSGTHLYSPHFILFSTVYWHNFKPNTYYFIFYTYWLTFGLPNDNLWKDINIFTVELRTHIVHLVGCNKIVYQIMHRMNNNIKNPITLNLINITKRTRQPAQ